MLQEQGKSQGEMRMLLQVKPGQAQAKGTPVAACGNRHKSALARPGMMACKMSNRRLCVIRQVWAEHLTRRQAKKRRHSSRQTSCRRWK